MDMDDVWWGVRWIGGPIFVLVVGISSCTNSQWYRDGQAQEAAQDAADRQPRVIREVDGCKVYAFKSGHWHYFTRCPLETTTEGNRTVRSGKTSRTESETITTQNR
jgi:hypothetical protein